LDPTRKQIDHVGDDQFRASAPRTSHDFRFFGGKVEHELPGNRLQQPSLMPERYPVSTQVGTRFEQRILHPRHLFQHGIQRPPDHRRTNPLAAQVTYFFDLQQIEKRVVLTRFDQPGLLPSLQLTRSNPQNAQQIDATVPVHNCEE
jgi:hypothetical protein